MVRLNSGDLTSASLPHKIMKVLCDLLVSTGFIAFAGAYSSNIGEYSDSSHGEHGPHESAAGGLMALAG